MCGGAGTLAPTLRAALRAFLRKQSGFDFDVKFEAASIHEIHQILNLRLNVAYVIEIAIKFARSVVETSKFFFGFFKIAVEFFKESDKSVSVVRLFHIKPP